MSSGCQSVAAGSSQNAAVGSKHLAGGFSMSHFCGCWLHILFFLFRGTLDITGRPSLQVWLQMPFPSCRITSGVADSADSDSEIPTEVQLLYCRYCKCCGFAAKNCVWRKELIFFNNVSRPTPGAERGRDHVHRSNSTCWGDSIGIARCCLGSTRCVEGGPTRPLFEGNLGSLR